MPEPDPELVAMLVSVQLIEDAISYRQALIASCTDCAPGGDRCAACERDATAVRIYQGQHETASRDALELGAADSGLVTDGGCLDQAAARHGIAILDCLHMPGDDPARPAPAARARLPGWLAGRTHQSSSPQASHGARPSPYPPPPRRPRPRQRRCR